MVTFKKDSKAARFLELYPVDENGKGPVVDVVDLPSDMQFGNGKSWMRDDGKFASNFVIKDVERGGSGNKLLKFQLLGYKKEPPLSQSIRRDIQKQIRKQRCAHTNSPHNIEVDHKDGRKDDLRVMNTATQKLEDFQPLTKEANCMKRQACKECKATGKKFDARELDYKKSVYSGTIKYDPKTGCDGCYWYDPRAFKGTCG